MKKPILRGSFGPTRPFLALCSPPSQRLSMSVPRMRRRSMSSRILSWWARAGPIRSVTDSPAPVDLIGAEDFTDQGTTNLPDLMRALVPSLQYQYPADQRRGDLHPPPPTCAGSRPTRRWWFVNGKRRHRAAVITFLGNGISDGAQGPDISVIPAIALKRVEVLRDTASAQYGSDAIAGVINFVPQGPARRAAPSKLSGGGPYEGDGGRIPDRDELWRSHRGNAVSPI